MTDRRRLRSYYFTAITSLVFALVGFSYNAWRLEVSEDNNNIRTAAFSMLSELAELEQIVFSLHYDGDTDAGNPRKGWIKVGLINDLSVLINPQVVAAAGELKSDWQMHWSRIADDQSAADSVVKAIDGVRGEIKRQLSSLK